jgi:hypothetical protein
MRHLVSLALAAALGACANATDPAAITTSEVDGSSLEITPAKASYGWNEVTQGGVRGTIRNVSDVPLYSNLGDAMSSSEEQEMLYLASADGGVERQTSATAWTRVASPPMIEGSRYVLLRPGQTYQFMAPLTGPGEGGTFRVAVSFRSTLNDEEQAAEGTSYSPTFSIR